MLTLRTKFHIQTIGLIAVLAAVPAPPISALSPTLTTLYSFQGGSDGSLPRAGVAIGRNTELFGTTYWGGGGPSLCQPEGCGTIFKLAPALAGTWVETVLHSFTGDDGADPESPVVIGGGGVLYGTTTSGSYLGGEAFALAPPTAVGSPWALTVLHLFQGGSDGLAPVGGLLLGPKGVLFGTTQNGGGACGGLGCGTVFELIPPPAPGGAWGENVLYSLKAPRPNSGLAVRNGILYGTTISSQGTNATAFRLLPPASSRPSWSHQVIFSLAGTYPAGVIVAPGGVLYGLAGGGPGTPACGGGGCGSVYELTPPAAPGEKWSQTVLYQFTNLNGDGYSPVGTLTLGSNGILYGSTSFGGVPSAQCSAGGGTGCGTIFQLAPPAAPGGAWTETVLYTFTGGTDQCRPNGGLVFGPDGALYGTTQGACSLTATQQQGTVFRLAL